MKVVALCPELTPTIVARPGCHFIVFSWTSLGVMAGSASCVESHCIVVSHRARGPLSWYVAQLTVYFAHSLNSPNLPLHRPAIVKIMIRNILAMLLLHQKMNHNYALSWVAPMWRRYVA